VSGGQYFGGHRGWSLGFGLFQQRYRIGTLDFGAISLASSAWYTNILQVVLLIIAVCNLGYESDTDTTTQWIQFFTPKLRKLTRISHMAMSSKIREWNCERINSRTPVKVKVLFSAPHQIVAPGSSSALIACVCGCHHFQQVHDHGPRLSR
jgi:hypothetical protein